MIKRHGLSDVLGGACVFPGGKVDPADCNPGGLARIAAPIADLHRSLGEMALDTNLAAGLFVAACRETFEEAGILLADGATIKHVEAATQKLRGGADFKEVLASLQLSPHWRGLIPWQRWITPCIPELMKKRFDARFFLAEAPPDQVARHDDHEATASFWMRPRVILEQYWAGRVALVPAQIMSLATLARYRGVAEVIDSMRAQRPPVIQPEPFLFQDSRALALPGDERHPVSTRAMPGPTFLVHRNARFEPLGGLDELFA